MKPVTPKVFFLAEHQMVEENVREWLNHIGGQEAVDCLKHVTGTDIEQLIELLARRCYLSYAPGLNPNVNKVRTDSSQYHDNIAASRHGSVVAHGSVTYAFEGVSRIFTHEAVRNRIGTEFSQESLRYVRLTEIPFWVPPIISGDFPGGAYPTKTLAGPPLLVRYLNALPAMHLSPQDIFEIVIETCEWGQAALATYFEIDRIGEFSTKKKLTSAFRRIAPMGTATGIGISFNLRSLRWILEQRTDQAAEEEMRLVMGMVAEHAINRWPMVFQDFEKVDTGDGLFHYKPKHSKI